MDEAIKTTRVELKNSRINIDLTGKYTPRYWFGITHTPSLLAASSDLLYTNNQVSTNALGFNMKRDDYVFQYFNNNYNNALLTNGDLLTVHHDGAFFDIDYPAGGTLSKLSRESNVNLLNGTDYLQGYKIINIKVSSDQKRILLYQEGEKGLYDERVISVDLSSGQNKITQLPTSEMRPIDFTIGETKFEDETVKRRRNIYAVSTLTPNKETAEPGKIFIFNENGSIKETIDQAAYKIISGPPGIFYFLTRDLKIGMINTAGFRESADKSEVKIIFDNPNQDEIIDMVNGTNNSVVFSTKKGKICVIDGSTGSTRGSKELGLKENQELTELSLEPQGKELFYVIKTVPQKKAKNIEFHLKSLHLSVSEK